MQFNACLSLFQFKLDIVQLIEVYNYLLLKLKGTVIVIGSDTKPCYFFEQCTANDCSTHRNKSLAEGEWYV